MPIAFPTPTPPRGVLCRHVFQLFETPTQIFRHTAEGTRAYNDQELKDNYQLHDYVFEQQTFVVLDPYFGEVCVVDVGSRHALARRLYPCTRMHRFGQRKMSREQKGKNVLMIREAAEPEDLQWDNMDIEPVIVFAITVLTFTVAFGVVALCVW